jgi:hypothetical protein
MPQPADNLQITKRQQIIEVSGAGNWKSKSGRYAPKQSRQQRMKISSTSREAFKGKKRKKTSCQLLPW